MRNSIAVALLAVACVSPLEAQRRVVLPQPAAAPRHVLRRVTARQMLDELRVQAPDRVPVVARGRPSPPQQPAPGVPANFLVEPVYLTHLSPQWPAEWSQYFLYLWSGNVSLWRPDAMVVNGVLYLDGELPQGNYIVRMEFQQYVIGGGNKVTLSGDGPSFECPPPDGENVLTCSALISTGSPGSAPGRYHFRVYAQGPFIFHGFAVARSPL